MMTCISFYLLKNCLCFHRNKKKAEAPGKFDRWEEGCLCSSYISAEERKHKASNKKGNNFIKTDNADYDPIIIYIVCISCRIE